MMKQLRLFQCFVLLLCAFSLPDFAWAQDNPPRDFDDWINRRVEQIAEARINQRGNTNQTETPSISGNTNSLVDQSSASDLLGVGLNLAGLTTDPDETKTTSASATISLYALYTAMLEKNPLDPAFYNSHSDWRRISITLGFEYPDEKGASSSERASLVGFKVLLWDKRDATHPDNRSRLKCVSDGLKASATKFNQIARLVEDYLYEVLAAPLSLPDPATEVSRIRFINDYLGEGQITTTLALLNDEQLQAIDEIISNRIDPEVALADTARKAIEAIRQAPQFSIGFQSKLRKEDGTDEYRGQAIFDYGVARRVNFSLNASFEYKDRKTMKEDSRGLRVAAEFQFQPIRESKLTGRKPWVFSLGGESNWMTRITPTYKGQAKITVPLVSGVDFPISLTFANRTELIDESDIRGGFGFTFDFAKLAKAFQ